MEIKRKPMETQDNQWKRCKWPRNVRSNGHEWKLHGTEGNYENLMEARQSDGNPWKLNGKYEENGNQMKTL